jgi:hypothetical protein
MKKRWTESTGCGPVVLSVHHGPTGRARPELTGGGARRRSRARDLAVVAWGARGADGDPYPGWHKLVEGLGRPGVVEGRRRWSKLNERCSGHEGKERRAKMCAVKMAGGVAPFYRVQEAMEGNRGGRPARWVLIPIGFQRILEEGEGIRWGLA